MEIKSIAVLDLEATNLHNPRITELAVVACERQHCINLGGKISTLPRIAHKLVLCVKPNAKIHPSAMIVSGIDNEDVMNCMTFEGVMDQLQSFLDRLPAPVCLIAHNGIKFDFSVLRREIERTNSNQLKDVYCADSLPAFRDIFPKSKKVVNGGSTIYSRIPPELSNSAEDLICLKALNELELTMIDSTPVEDTAYQKLNETTPKSQRRKFGYSQENNICKVPQRRVISERSVSLAVKKNLFGSDSAGHPATYKLIDIYQFLHGCQFPDAHRAENDAVALMECIVRVGDTFFKWVDNHAVLFSDL